MKTLNQKVTRDDIKGADRDSWVACPLARAIRRTFPDVKVDVFDECIWINGETFSHTGDSFAFARAWNEGSVRPRIVKVPDFGIRYRRPIPPLTATLAPSEPILKGGDEVCAPQQHLETDAPAIQTPSGTTGRETATNAGASNAAEKSDPPRAAEPDFIRFARLLAKAVDGTYHVEPLSGFRLSQALKQAIEEYGKQ